MGIAWKRNRVPLIYFLEREMPSTWAEPVAELPIRGPSMKGLLDSWAGWWKFSWLGVCELLSMKQFSRRKPPWHGLLTPKGRKGGGWRLDKGMPIEGVDNYHYIINKL